MHSDHLIKVLEKVGYVGFFTHSLDSFLLPTAASKPICLPSMPCYAIHSSTSPGDEPCSINAIVIQLTDLMIQSRDRSASGRSHLSRKSFILYIPPTGTGGVEVRPIYSRQLMKTPFSNLHYGAGDSSA